MSIYSKKSSSSGGVQPWANALTLFPGGGDVSTFFNLYPSLGDITFTGSNTVPTLQDGPEKIVRYGNLVLGDGTTSTSLTALNRNKGLCILCETLTVKNNATLNMTGKGPRVLTNDDPYFPFVDFKIPTQITLSSSWVAYAQALKIISQYGLSPWDQGTWQALVSSLFGVNLAVSQAGVPTLLAVSGCGAALASNSGSTNSSGNPGNAGSSGGTGSGGQGGYYQSSPARSGAGTPYGGGAGTGGMNNTATTVTQLNQVLYPVIYSSPGGDAYTNNSAACSGGAGIPGGAGSSGGGNGSTGVGGKLVIIARTSVTVQSGGKIEANGMPGGTGATYNGGGSGGGHVSIITPPGGLSNSGTIQAAGGTGSGAGGAGSVVTKTFTDMGW